MFLKEDIVKIIYINNFNENTIVFLIIIYLLSVFFTNQIIVFVIVKYYFISLTYNLFTKNR